jgi:hypothetical protein
MLDDRQMIALGLIEGALRAASDPSVTTVLRDWDWYGPGDTAQPLCPFLNVGMIDDTPYGIGLGLYRAQVQIMISVVSSPSIRADFDRIRASVRAVMASLRGLAAGGVFLSGAIETGCTQPADINASGDVVYAQVLTYTVWFEAPPPPQVVTDPDIYLVAYDPETGVTYTTTQAQDPRRIAAWRPTPTGVLVCYAFGDWADRASLTYSVPVQPLSTQTPPAVPAAAENNNP